LTAWEFAVAAWRRPDVEALCLELQSIHGQSPPLLLWGLWLVSQGRTPALAVSEKAVDLARDWERQVVEPLRDVRDRLKAPDGPGPPAARLLLRQSVLKVELEAERLLLESLESLETTPTPAPRDPLTALLDLAQAWRSPAPRTLLAKLVLAV